jgi:diacylglycerol kinase
VATVTGDSGFWRGFAHAGHGIRQAVGSERNLRVQLAAGTAALATGALLRLSTVEWAAVLLAAGLVLTAELVNSAVETVVDLASPDQHPLAGRAKDIAAGACLVASVTAAAVGALVFLPHLPVPW